jgi:hypothetical protein
MLRVFTPAVRTRQKLLPDPLPDRKILSESLGSDTPKSPIPFGADFTRQKHVETPPWVL